MKIFVAGTGTGVGKTLISSWLCIHSGYHYFKPLQTGSEYDSSFVYSCGVQTHKEIFSFTAPLSPHQAAKLEGKEIDIDKLKLPKMENLIVEGVGGIMVPISENHFMVDVIDHFQIPVILIVDFYLGMINHAVLSIEALRKRNIKVLGLIINKCTTEPYSRDIEYYTDTEIIAEIPVIMNINRDVLLHLKPGYKIKKIMNIQ